MKRKILGISIAVIMVVSTVIPIVSALPQGVDHQPGIRLTTHPDYERNPSFVVDSTGMYWLFYTRADTGGIRGQGGYNPDTDYYVIWYLQSTDKGTTWGIPTRLARSAPSPTGNRPVNFNQRDVAAIVDGNDIYVFAASGYGGGGNNNIYYYKYSSGSWSGPTQVFQSDGMTPVVGGHIDVVRREDNGDFWLFYEKGSQGVYAVYSTDQGTTWSDEIFVAQGPVNSYGGVPKAIWGSKFYVVFSDQGDGIYLTTSSDGTTWTTPTLIYQSPDPVYDYDPMIYKTADGTLYLFWAPYSDPAAGGVDSQWISYTYSTDDGVTWNPAPPKLTSGGFPAWLYDHTQTNVTWWDFWPEVYEDPVSHNLLLFYTSEASDDGKSMIDGNIWFKNLGVLPELTEGTTEDTQSIDTRVQINGDPNGANKPIVKCKWEWVAPDGDDNLDVQGLQIDPDLRGSKTIHFYAVVTAPYGESTVASVYADVFHPDGTFKYQVTLQKMEKDDGIQVFDETESNPSIVKYNIGHYVNDEWYEIDRAEVREELTEDLASVWHGTAEISYCQPAGKYRVDIRGVSNTNDWGDPLNNNFWYVPTTAIETDFTQVDYGSVAINSWKSVGGDKDMSTPNKPTVRNIGNVPVELYVNQSDMGFGKNYGGEWNVQFEANLGYPDDHGKTGVYNPFEEVRIPGVLELCTEEKMDFHILAKKGQPNQVFVGWMNLIARQHGQPPYQTPKEYIDQ